MLTPFEITLINLFIFVSLSLAGFIINKRFKSFNFVSLKVIIILSLLPLWSMFRPGPYESSDMNIHIVRFISFYEALSEGNLFPYWSERLNATYGMPVFLFVQTLPYYISAIFKFLGFGFIESIKLQFVFSYILSGFFMYIWGKKEFGNKGGFLAALSYQFAPYHLLDMHFRGNPGETMAFTFLPLSLIGIKYLISKATYKWFVITSFSNALIILAHPIAVITYPFIFLVAIRSYLINRKKNFSIIIILLSFLIGCAISSFYWFPSLYESKYTLQSYYHSVTSFVDFKSLIFSPWKFGLLNQGPQGQLSNSIGYIQLLALGFGIYYSLKNLYRKGDKTYFIFLLLSLLFFVYLMLPISKWLWEMLPVIKNLQFSSRILVVVVLITSMILGLISKYLKPKAYFIFCILIILISLPNWTNRNTIPVFSDKYFQEDIPQSSYFYEGSTPSIPKWVDPKHPVYRYSPNKHLEILTGEAKMKNLKRRSTFHSYLVTVEQKAQFKENTLYFPGWEVYVNGEKKEIVKNHPKYPGVITFMLDKGTYYITVEFRDTNARFFSRVLSIIVVLFIVAASLYFSLRRN